MNEQFFKWHHCGRKAIYNKQSSALKAIKKMKAKGYITSSLNPYLCKYCNKWHIGNSKESK